MGRDLTRNQNPSRLASPHEEGELYAVVDVHGTEFRLYYGYYTDSDRDNPLVEPLPIYPNLKEKPHYTADGLRIVTRMQDACEQYRGRQREDRVCKACESFSGCAAFFGVCRCPANRDPARGGELPQPT